jgi:glutamyl aminopeptidase
VAKKYSIKTQDFISPGGTNAGIIHLSNEGIFTIQNGIVARSLHTQSSICNMNDYQELIKFVIAELKELNENIINSFNFEI